MIPICVVDPSKNQENEDKSTLELYGKSTIMVWPGFASTVRFGVIVTVSFCKTFKRFIAHCMAWGIPSDSDIIYIINHKKNFKPF
jgi:hypothetical protein